MYPQPKPLRGEHVLEREDQRAKDRKAEAVAKTKAKVEDNFTCRWPEKHICRGLLEGAHLKDKSLGGEDVPENLITLCSWIHRRGPESIHGKQLRIEPETPRGARGPCSFWRHGYLDGWICVGVELRIGVLRKV